MQQPTVDLAFSIRGASVPLDHGYALFGAVSRIVPKLHEQKKWGIHPIHGRQVGPGKLSLVPNSLLTIRLPVSEIGELLALSGKTLDVAGSEIVVGIPRVFPLKQLPLLRSRFVTIKSFKDDGDGFKGAVLRQLSQLQVSQKAEVTVGPRRVVRVSSHIIVGFPVEIAGLSTDEAVIVQTEGLGGRRHMGAGLFLAPGDSQE